MSKGRSGGSWDPHEKELTASKKQGIEETRFTDRGGRSTSSIRVGKKVSRFTQGGQKEGRAVLAASSGDGRGRMELASLAARAARAASAGRSASPSTRAGVLMVRAGRSMDLLSGSAQSRAQPVQGGDRRGGACTCCKQSARPPSRSQRFIGNEKTYKTIRRGGGARAAAPRATLVVRPRRSTRRRAGASPRCAGRPDRVPPPDGTADRTGRPNGCGTAVDLPELPRQKASRHVGRAIIMAPHRDRRLRTTDIVRLQLYFPERCQGLDVADAS